MKPQLRVQHLIDRPATRRSSLSPSALAGTRTYSTGPWSAMVAARPAANDASSAAYMAPSAVATSSD